MSAVGVFHFVRKTVTIFNLRTSQPGEPIMALVSYVSNQNAAEKVKPVFEGMEKKLGAVPNIFRVMAHNPEMLEAFLALNATLPKSQLNGKLRELAYIKTSELNDCDYCLHHHLR